MPAQRIKLIVNPNADLGQAWCQASDLRPIVDEYGGADWSGTVYPTHAVELAYQAAEAGYDLVIAVGGDGTVHEVVNGLMKAPPGRRPRLGVVPLGSGNDFAYAVGMDLRPSYALRQILSGSPHLLDVGRLEDGIGRKEYWVNVVGIGFDAVVNIRSRKVPLVRGFLLYLIAVIQTILLNHQAVKMQMRLDERQWDVPLLMIVLCNGSREGGGFLVAPEANPGDGVLNFAAIQSVSRSMMFRLLPEVLRGTHGRFPQVFMGKFERFVMQADRPMYIHTDGEMFAGFGSDIRSLKVEIVPQALELVR